MKKKTEKGIRNEDRPFPKSIYPAPAQADSV